MTAKDDTDPRLEEWIEHSYQAFREPNPSQREAILNALLQPVRTLASPRRRSRLRWWSALSGFACAAVLCALYFLRNESIENAAFGIEDIPQRLTEVQSIRLSGWIYAPQPGPWSSPLPRPFKRFTFEMAVKRPGKFRCITTGIGSANGTPVVHQALAICNGERVWSIDEGGALLSVERIGPLDARLKTESIAQDTIAGQLSSRDAAFHKAGTEAIGGIRCDVYEQQPDRGSPQLLTRIWFDPKSGFPKKMLSEMQYPGGKREPALEIDDVSVNTPLDDALFEFHPSEGQTVAGGKPAAKLPLANGQKPAGKPNEPGKAAPAELLDARPQASGQCGGPGGNRKIEAWYALRIADNAALVVWRRSEPEPAADGSRDWLSNITLTLFGSGAHVVPHHEWIYAPESATEWSWSLVAVPAGNPLPVRDVALVTETNRDRVTVRLRALRFRDDELDHILVAARHSGLFGGLPPMSVSYLRGRAQRLAESK